MMYMTKAHILDAREACTLAQRGFYACHQAVWRLFDEDSVKDRDFLYRRVTTAGGNISRQEFLIVSGRKPRALPTWNTQTKTYDPDINKGERLHFSLTANPTRVVTDTEGRKKRVDVVMHAKHELRKQGVRPKDMPSHTVLAMQAGLDWLKQRAQRLGLEFIEPTLSAEGYRQHTRPPAGSRRTIRFSTLDFSGLANITDPDALRLALFQGVGPAKGFGCGLLLVRRA